MNGEIKIRTLTADDIHALQKIGRQTFSETFAAENTEENMHKYLEEGFSDEKLGNELANPSSRFWLAESEGIPAGYMKVNFGTAQTEKFGNSWMEIERIYVLKEFQRQKIGQLLYDKAIEAALQSGIEYVWLGVWENNLKAISFYRKNGFTEFDKHIFKLGDDEQTDLLMKLRLNETRNL
jgi:diamine N-acetyltransferase